MGVRPSRLAGMLVGCVAITSVIGIPAAAQPAADQNSRVTVAGNVPAWATPRTKVGDASNTSQREIRLALGLRHGAEAQRLAKEISTPGSPRYRKPLTAAEFTARFSPTQQMVDQISNWLRTQGLAVTSIAENHHFVTARGSVARLEIAFGTHLAIFRVGGRALTAPEQDVSVPATVCRCISAVLGLDDQELTNSSASPPRSVAAPGQSGGPAPDGQNWSTPAATTTVGEQQGHRSESRTAKPAATAVTPGRFCSRFWAEFNNTEVPQKYPEGQQANPICGYTVAQTRGIYGLNAAQTGAGQTVALTGNFSSANTAADVNRWAVESGAPGLAAGQYEAKLPPGGGDPNPGCDREEWVSEQAMDVEAVHAVAPAAKIIWYSAEGCSARPALNAAVAENRASIISNSWNVTAGENGVAPAFRDQLEAITIQAAIQGQAILFSSGDLGDNSRGTGQVNPLYPSSDPWVTAVGVDSNRA